MPKGGRLFKEGTYGSWIQDTIEQLFNQVAFIKKNKEDPAWQKKNEEFVPPADNVPYVHNDPSMMAAQTRASTLFTELYLMAGAMKHDNPKLHDPLPSPAYMDSIRSRAFEDGARQENLELFHFTKIDQTAKQFALDGKNPPTPRRMIDMLAQVYQVREEKKKEESVKEAEPEKEQAAVKQEAPVKESEGKTMPNTRENMDGTMYERFMSLSRNALQSACEDSVGGYNNIVLRSSEQYEQVKGPVKSSISLAIAYTSIAQEFANENGFDTAREKELKELAVKRQKEIEQSAEFQVVIGGASMKELRNMVGEMGKDGRWNVVPFHEFNKRFDKQVESHKPEIKQRRAELRQEKQKDREVEQRKFYGKLVKDLEQSTQKSFTGKLKSFFVGNSAQYNLALNAMKDLSSKENMTPEEKDNATKAITDYLSLRGKKVRDHEYGRDRFDAFMKGAAMLMEPREFVNYCDQINKDRGAIDNNYKGHIDAQKFMSDEKKAALEDIARIEEDINNPIPGEIYQSFYSVLRTADQQSKEEIENLNDFLREHPGVRKIAREVVEEKGFKNVKVPDTPDLGKEEANLKKLETNANLFDVDRFKQPEKQAKGAEMQA